MFTTTILIAGGVVLAGTRLLWRRKQVRTPVWLIQQDGSRVKSYAMVVESDEAREASQERALTTSYRLSTVSLGLSLASELIIEPLKWLGLPIDIYNFALIVEQGYTGQYGPRRGAQLAAISIFVVTFILSDQFLMVSLIQWCYFFYRKAGFQLYKRLRYMAPTPAPAEA
ncbi:MAG: hypothetical protein HGA65_03700 [Oscillochloris sp.]|nr:hypothetical protein [Oscillochloris sp.]